MFVKAIIGGAIIGAQVHIVGAQVAPCSGIADLVLSAFFSNAFFSY